ncbi:MAG: hypothetical protein C0613_10805 [Desulfobulbaceae bacterium]|nr:MAG: hypothetical protein C0613_10805 [Desulfobulbaceae bacterium]
MTLAKKNNEHIPVDVLARLLAEELAAIEGDVGSRVVLESLGKLKSGADNTTMALVRSATGQPKAVISCSRPAAPDLIKRGVEEAEAIRGLIGEPLGAAIIKPIASGYVDGRSYVILPWYRELAGWKPFWLMQRLALRRPLLRWLSHSTAVAASAHGSSEKQAKHTRPCLHISPNNLLLMERSVQPWKKLSGGWRVAHGNRCTLLTTMICGWGTSC